MHFLEWWKANARRLRHKWREYEQQYRKVMSERKEALTKLWRKYEGNNDVVEPASKKPRTDSNKQEEQGSTTYQKGVIVVVSNIPPKTSKTSLKVCKPFQLEIHDKQR